VLVNGKMHFLPCEASQMCNMHPFRMHLFLNCRKPKVTRKVVDDENPGQETSQDDDVVDDAMNLAIQVG